ncbi:TIGR01841 family phasin [Limibaculum sp. M0105]|uniref:TIGR01841 family phasin n=1 Tax=Thermohalobaculum xanthum TaxID=2753746 RepID=A0A8J7M5H0_9RHOB|nr:TIGR01841 family phasin [Thermohalobaculum xanthum]MBK0398714.1 TIGR01841 family phasin [Thermohalobaculum xanthum]
MTKAETKKVEEFAAEAQKSIEQNVEKVAKGVEDAAAFGQENVEALVTSSKIAAKALETVNAEMLAYSKKAYEDGLAAAKDMTACKSISELVEKQTAFGKSAFEGFVAQATKVNEILTAASKDAAEPMSARVTAAMGAFKGLSA